jgi:general secretion pathway protein F
VPVFAYKAAGDDRRSVSGTLTADSPRQARDLLRARGLRIEQVTEQRARRATSFQSTSKPTDIPGNTRPDARWRRRPGHQRQVARLIRELATLLGVGVPLAEALYTLSRHNSGRLKTSVLLLRDRVTAGVNLAAAMAEQPRLFDDLCVHITEVGEDAGTLDLSLHRLAEFKERTSQLKSRLGAALIYPAIVLCMAVGVSVFLMTFVVPGILAPLIDQGKPLPLPTQIVKGASDLLVSDWWFGILMVVGLFALGMAIMRNAAGRRAFDRLVLKLPLIGELLRKQAVVRLSVVVATLLRSGVTMVRALQVAERSMHNVVLQSAVRTCHTAVMEGRDVAAALETVDVFPPLLTQVFAIGQHSGNLDEILDRLGRDYDAELSLASQRLTAVLEPILILIMASIVLCIALATMLPILEAGDVLH